jgi:hypothetical protein
MIRNYLSGKQGDEINTILAATGFNFMKMLWRLNTEAIFYWLKLLEYTKMYSQVVNLSY